MHNQSTLSTDILCNVSCIGRRWSKIEIINIYLKLFDSSAVKTTIFDETKSANVIAEHIPFETKGTLTVRSLSATPTGCQGYICTNFNPIFSSND